MFKRSQSVENSSAKLDTTTTNKSKQSSLLDFFAHSSTKSKSSQLSVTSSKQKEVGTKRLASAFKSFSKKRRLQRGAREKSLEEGGAKSESCPSRLLEDLVSMDDHQLGFCVESNDNTTSSNDENIKDNLKDVYPIEIPETQELVPNSKNNEDIDNVDSPLLFDSEPLPSTSATSNSKQSSVSRSPDPLTLGKPIHELQRTPHCREVLPKMQPSNHHTVLFDETLPGTGPPPPRDPQYKDAWDSYHVRLPCSPKNLYPVNSQGPYGKNESLQSRWVLIESSLLMPINSSYELEDAILKYNSRYANLWSFRALHKFFAEDVDDIYRRDFFSNTLPSVIRLALMLPRICTQPVPLLSRQRNHKVTLTQQQIACLLCNAFLCTYPWRNSKKSTSEYSQYPDINFSRLLSGSTRKEDVVSEKLKMIFHYFKRVTTQMPDGTVTFERRALSNFPNWNESPCTLCGLHITSEGMIETEGKGMLQVDFANRYIGGGVLGAGSVQEEIRFCVCPELIISRLFCEAMDDNECIVITGAEQFTSYTGYGSTLQCTGDFVDTTARDEWRRRETQIVAMDALPWANHQYSTANLKRELNKAYCGFFCDFNPDHYPAIATGNWGCGAFGGDPILKSLLQLLAAATIGRDLCYFTFGDVELVKNIHKMHSFIVEKQLQIRNVWRALIRFNAEIVSTGANEDLLEFIERIHGEYDDSTDENI